MNLEMLVRSVEVLRDLGGHMVKMMVNLQGFQHAVHVGELLNE